MDSYDVVIVGAGPAGLRCAEVLGGSKYRVLLLEKNSEIGPKVCAGGLTSKDVNYLNLPKSLIESHSNEIKIYVNASEFVFRNKEDFIFSVDRKRLGQWQLEKLRKFKNVEVRTNARVSKIDENFVVVNDNEKIGYRFLVGADGSSSSVRRYLGVKSNDVDIAIQYIILTKKYRDFEIFLDSRLFSSWYAWIFPHRDYVSVGCGSNPKVLSSKELMANFKEWLVKNEIDVSKGRYEAFMINYDYRGYRFGNVFLAGDAAGLASGLTGKGIYRALVSGGEIGKIILDENYEPYEIEEILKIKRKHERLMSFFVKSGRMRTAIFYFGMFMLKIPYFKKKALKLFT